VVNVMVRALLVVFLSIPMLVCVKQNTPIQGLPDYTAWDKEGMGVSVVLNGQAVNLLGEVYLHTDMDKLEESIIAVIYDINKNAWLAFYTKELSEKKDNDVVIKESKHYMYERKGDGWSLVKDFSGDHSDKTITDFLKDNYNMDNIELYGE